MSACLFFKKIKIKMYTHSIFIMIIDDMPEARRHITSDNHRLLLILINILYDLCVRDWTD